MATTETIETDVLIIGAGPIGATFARYLSAAKRRVLLIDAGAQHSRRPGEHLKNAFVYQRDLDRFTPIVQGLLNPLSVAPVVGERSVLDPIAFRTPDRSFRSAHNPKQDPRRNLDAAAASYGVGGMFTHWTNNTPRHHPELERSDLLPSDVWDALYTRAEQLLNTHTDVFDRSLRHQAVLAALDEHYGSRLPDRYGVRSLPTAGERRTDNDEFVRFTGVDTVLGPLADDPQAFGQGNFTLREHFRCKRLVVKKRQVTHAVVEDLMSWHEKEIRAQEFVVACGAILTPQLLWASGIRPKALGRYLHEHPMSFAQIILRDEIVEDVRSRAIARGGSDDGIEADPVPIPMHDPPPMVWIPVSDARPWHCQIHRDSFAHGSLPPDVDDRLVVDLRWFGMVDPVETNLVTFEDDLLDKFGMPRPTFQFTLGSDDRVRAHDMMSDMIEAGQVLGGFLAGSEPRFLPPGSSLHMQGTARMGGKDDGTSVVDTTSVVWGFDNLRLGGNALLPQRNASNPTLTSVALALHAIDNLLAPSRRFPRGSPDSSSRA